MPCSATTAITTSYCYYKVTNATGTEVLLETKSEPERVLSEDTAEVMRELLKTVPARDFRKSKNLASSS